ncbi:hypothetical protein C5748_04990 [Phyllobacterium phragmitis]|uniref:Uncharacterized protein n=1 Tax=Phyllobacterium phragmitis TaxID=2670329 RepID=A0A2S9IW52_9HYPH|nr:DUF4432 family protein [Phyllobacterium phragmitis]PRD44755.1 hypothetical protein C5748_04990 [Phyllobacterium phragmitis]
MSDASGFTPDPPVRVKDYKIGCIGAGMIMSECHLAAYREAGFPVVAIASRTFSKAKAVAERWRIPAVHETSNQLIADQNVEILDIAFPPDQQPDLIRAALRQPHIKAILAQKPLALTLDEAIALRDEAAKAGANEIRLHDRVVNRGFYRTPHMYCYHINVGYPVLADGARYLAPISDVVWAAHAGDSYKKQDTGYRTMPPPQMRFHEQVWQHEMAADRNGEVPVALVNDRLGIGFEVVTRKDQFPCMYEWQNFQAGQYALGLEPSTNHVLGHGAARERGELICLEHGEERRYDTTMRILPDDAAITASESRIRAIAAQPQDDYPQPSGNHLPLRGPSA